MSTSSNSTKQVWKWDGKGRKNKGKGGKQIVWNLCVCVCVSHLNRCKTSNLAGGWSMLQMSPSNEDASVAQWYGLGTLNPGTCSIFFIFVHGNQLSQEPACRFSTFFKPNNCTVFAIWLSCIRTRKSFEQGRRKISFAQFLTSNHSTIPVRFNWSVFCTCDAVHINNSIRYFWASVWLMPDPSRWYEPFGDSLSRLTVDSKSMSEFTLLN